MRFGVYLSLAFFFLYGSVSATTFTVTSAIDFDGTCQPNDCSLRRALNSVQDGDTIVFASPNFDTFQSINLVNGPLVNTHQNITIIGPGRDFVNIDPNFSSRVLLNSGSLTISGVTMTRGRDSIYAGCVYNNGTLTLNDSTVTNCRANDNREAGTGAGILNTGTLYLNRTLVTNNSPINTTGRVFGVGVANSGFLTIDACEFLSNSTSSNGGGSALYNTGQATITNSTFAGNDTSFNSGNFGGTIKSSGALRLINSTVTDNTMSAGQIGQITYGTGVYADGGSLTLINDTITGNTAAAPLAGDPKGVGVYSLSNVVLKMVNTFVSNNTATIGSNPFPNADYFGPASPGPNNLIGGNEGTDGLTNNGGFTRTRMLYPNSAAVNGGNSCVLVANGCSGFSNPALTTDQRGYPRQLGFGVDIGSVERSVNVTNANTAGAGSLADVIANAGDGDPILFDSTFFNQPRTITLSPVTLSKSLAIVGTGATNVIITTNSNGRMFYVNSGKRLDLSGLRLTGGRVNNSNAGCIYNDGGTVNASSVQIDNCQTNFSGGAIYNNGTFNLTSSVVTNNQAGNGGGILNESGNTLTVQSSTVSNNTAVGYGGGIFNVGPLHFYNSTLSGNTAGIGGGLSVGPGGVDMINATVSGNTANNGPGGGAFTNGGEVLFATNSTFANNTNTSNQTGGVLVAGGGIFRIRNTIVANNSNGNNSGAQDVSGSIISLGSNLIGNSTGNSFDGASPDPTGNLVGVQAKLAPLGNYGGPTQTHMPLPGSPAIDAGKNCVLDSTCASNNAAFAVTTDQRGGTALRKIGSAIDMGATETSITFDNVGIPIGHLLSPYPSVQLSATRAASFNMASAVTHFAIVPAAGEQLPPGITLSPSGLLSGQPTQIGSYKFTVAGADADGIAGANTYTIVVIGPTAASVSLSGRVFDAQGNGLRNALITLDLEGQKFTARSGAFGGFSFEEVPGGGAAILTANVRGYIFAPRTVSLSDTVTGLELYPDQIPR